MPISLTTETAGKAIVRKLKGRLDAHGASEIEPALLTGGPSDAVILDLSAVDYISSGGIRIFVSLHKQLHSRGGRMILCGLQPYCREVLKVSGLDQFFTTFETLALALAEIGVRLESWDHDCGRFVFHKGSDDAGGVEVLGNIEDVLASRVTPELVRSKKFSAKEYSIGLGALGPDVASVMPFIGEMITIGGTMVWLPTDGNDTPDFLVPHQDSDAVVIRTGFNASISGRFNEYAEFNSANPEGATLTEVYCALFDYAKKNRPDYKGAITLAMRAEIGNLYGCGVVKSPVASHAPANGKWITDSSNYDQWFEVDKVPRHKNVSGLICGLGVDMDEDLSGFNQEYLNAAFYLNPGNAENSREKLHNHGVFFRPFPLGERPFSLEREIQSVVEGGEFIDMRHLFDKTTIQWAYIGIVYVQDFFPDTAAE